MLAEKFPNKSVHGADNGLCVIGGRFHRIRAQVFPDGCDNNACSCLPASSMSNRLIIALLSLSRWLMGSSRKIKSNGWQRLRIKATRCCCPKESLPALSSVLSGMPVASKRARISFSSYGWSGGSLTRRSQERSAREDTQFLEKDAERMFPYICPFADGE